jgi:hypothetical protein
VLPARNVATQGIYYLGTDTSLCALCSAQDVLRAVSTGLKGGHVNFGTSGISDMDPGGGDSGEVGCGNDVEDAISERKKGKDPHWLELRSMGEAGMAALEAYVKDLFAMGDGWGYADIKVAKKRMDKARHVLSKKHKMVPPVSRRARTPANERTSKHERTHPRMPRQAYNQTSKSRLGAHY